MTLEKHANFEEKLFFCLKNDMRNFVNLNVGSGKSENLRFDGLLLQKVCDVWAKKYRGFKLRKMTFGFENDISHFVNFHTSSWKYVRWILCMNFSAKVGRQISIFRTFHCLSEVAQILHVIFETRFWIDFAPFCNILAKHKCKV